MPVTSHTNSSNVTAQRTPSGWRHALEIVSDLLIATALIWTLPLLLGATVAILSRLL